LQEIPDFRASKGLPGRDDTDVSESIRINPWIYQGRFLEEEVIELESRQSQPDNQQLCPQRKLSYQYLSWDGWDGTDGKVCQMTLPLNLSRRQRRKGDIH